MPAIFHSALVIDDDHAFRTTMQMALRRRGIRAKTAATVEEALVVLDDESFELVILDQRLPKMDGLSCVEMLRARCPHGTLVMLTGHGDIALAVAATKRGVDHFFTKPIVVDTFLSEIRKSADTDRSANVSAAGRSLNLEQVERDTIASAMARSGGVITQAAKLLGIDRRTLQRKLRRID